LPDVSLNSQKDKATFTVGCDARQWPWAITLKALLSEYCASVHLDVTVFLSRSKISEGNNRSWEILVPAMFGADNLSEKAVHASVPLDKNIKNTKAEKVTVTPPRRDRSIGRNQSLPMVKDSGQSFSA
jgi:hypothetical protein